jgi:Uncharacterized protein conserved in archaea
VVLELSADLRETLKEPLGPVFADVTTAIQQGTDTTATSRSSGPESGSGGRVNVIAVGDVVTSDLLAAGRMPRAAIVDGRTERSAVPEPVAERLASADFERERRAENPPGALTAGLAAAVAEAVDETPTLISVDGEEDLAALPAVLAAPSDTTVVYGQPGDGVVAVTADAAASDRVRAMLAEMDGDTEAFLAALST